MSNAGSTVTPVAPILALLGVALLIGGCSTIGAPSGSTACNRACLKGNIDRYLAAMLAHDPKRLALTADARFTEDTVEKPLTDSSLWKSATALRGFRQDYLDVHSMNVVPTAAGWPVPAAHSSRPVART